MPTCEKCGQEFDTQHGVAIHHGHAHGAQYESGDKFGKLEVIEDLGTNPNKEYKRFYRCQCECGEKAIVSQNALVAGQASCGCLAKRPRKSWNEGWYKRKRNKIRARKDPHNFELTLKQFTYLVRSNCAYCGQRPNNRPWLWDEIYKDAPPVNGIDRINSEYGYTIDNVVPACSTCNKMKLTQNINEFLQKIEEIYHHTQKYGSPFDKRCNKEKFMRAVERRDAQCGARRG